MTKKCDRCKKNTASVSYTEVVNNKTIHFDLCSMCANQILSKKEQFLNSFFSLDPFLMPKLRLVSVPAPTSAPAGKTTQPKQVAKKPTAQKPVAQVNPKEEQLKELKIRIDNLKQEEGIAVMLQDYLKAAEIKKKRDRLQKEAEKIINQ
ncbi:MAG: hypothetical protein WC604_01485 [Candidatus Gracilibacteria bacterium]